MTVPAQPQRSLGAILRDHLDAEIAVMRTWIATAEAKQAAVIANDLAALDQLLKREEPHAIEAARLRQVRERLVQGLAQRLAIPGTPRLSVLIPRLGADGAGCEERRRELMNLALRLQGFNERTQLLLRSGLELIEGVLSVVAGAPRQAGVYTRRGPSAPRGGGGLVDIRG
jgi:hypothetical protein